MDSVATWAYRAGGGADDAAVAHPAPGQTQPTPDRALEIARARYAKGEISQTEFETLKKNLGG